MKPNAEQAVHHVDQGMGQSIRMTIAQGVEVHLMQLLTDLYSNPILAFIREYSTNARDSHIEAGFQGPIIVHLPSPLDPTFSVQDFGMGLDVNDLQDVYSMYGKSTKRESDDVTGTLGLGCKSGLTYTLSFSVTAVKHGLKTTAMVTKDTDGVGTIKILDTSATNESNGVKISIPVQSGDIQNVCDEATRFFQYWRPGTVLLDGEEPQFDYDEALWLDDNTAILPDYSHDGMIIMGDIPYSPKETNWSSLPYRGVIAWVPMGSIHFTPSREALQFSEKTKKTLADVYEFVGENIATKVQELVDAAETPYEKLLLANRWKHLVREPRTALPNFMDMSAVTEGRIAWSVRPGGRNGSLTASKWEKVGLDSLVGTFPIVTGFPMKTASNGARQRFENLGWFAPGATVTASWADRHVVVIPEDADLEYLKGRDNVHTWEDVVAKTPKPVRQALGTPRVASPYLVYHGGQKYKTEQIVTTDPIIYGAQYEGYYMEQFPEAHGAVLTDRRLDKFLRLHPTAVRISEYRDKVIKELRAALTEEDKIWWGRPNYLYDRLTKIVTSIEDPELKKVVLTIRDHKPSDALTRLRSTFNVGGEPHPIHTKMLKRYPLMQVGFHQEPGINEDLIFYINAKYQSLKEDSNEV